MTKKEFYLKRIASVSFDSYKFNSPKILEFFLSRNKYDLEMELPGSGSTILCLMVKRGFINCVKVLLKLGANINTRDNFERNAIFWASKEGNIEMVKFLYGLGGNLNIRDHSANTALIWAAYDREYEIVKFLLSLDKLDINAQDGDGRTALMWAAKNGDEYTTFLLLRAGADATILDNENRDAAYLAFNFGYPILSEKIKKFLKEDYSRLQVLAGLYD